MTVLASKTLLQEEWVNAYLEGKTHFETTLERQESCDWAHWKVCLNIEQSLKSQQFLRQFFPILPHDIFWQLLWVSLILYNIEFTQIFSTLAWDFPYDRKTLMGIFRKQFHLPPVAVQHFFHFFRKTPFSQFGIAIRRSQRLFSCSYTDFLLLQQEFPGISKLTPYLYTETSRSLCDLLRNKEYIKRKSIFSCDYEIIKQQYGENSTLAVFLQNWLQKRYKDLLMLQSVSATREALSWYLINTMSLLSIREMPLTAIYLQKSFPTPYNILGLHPSDCYRLLTQMTDKFYGVTLWKDATILLSDLS